MALLNVEEETEKFRKLLDEGFFEDKNPIKPKDPCFDCEHTEDECDSCYSELGYKNNKLRRDTEAVKEFVDSPAFQEMMGWLK